MPVNWWTRSPNDVGWRFLFGAVSAGVGDLETAETEYRKLIAEGNSTSRVYLELVRVLNAQRRFDEAQIVVAEGLEAFPDGGDLLWMKASFAEQARDFDTAIAIYEKLYERNTSTSVIANNLASLLSTARDDQESLDRAWRIARRLRDSDFAHSRTPMGGSPIAKGPSTTRLPISSPAAKGLPNDPLVQYHLGMAYHAKLRSRDARAALETALALAGDDPRPQFDTARATLQEILDRDNPAPARSGLIPRTPVPLGFWCNTKGIEVPSGTKLDPSALQSIR